MSKNTTRKGLAFGAGLSLIATGFVSLPANASGIDNGFVSLAPASGTAYRVLATSTFDLKANGVTSLQNGGGSANLKFQVLDPDSRTKADWATAATSAASATYTAGSTLTGIAVSSATTVTATVTTPTLDANDKLVGHSASVTATADLVNGKVFTQATGITAAYATTGLTIGPLTITDAVLEDVIGLNSRAAILAAAPGDVFQGTAGLQATIGGVAVNNTTKRLSDGSYVVDTKTNTNGSDRILRLVNTDATRTTTVTVTAWVDDNDNGVIDTTEYRSPARIVSFHINSDLTVTTALDTPILGATGAGGVTGTVTIAPELNGEQVGNTAVTATATHQTAGQSVTVNSSTYSSTLKLWAISGTPSAAIVVGNYTMRASVAGAAIGNTATASVITRVSVDTEGEVSGTADTTYAYSANATPATANVRPGKSAVVTFTVYGTGGVATGTPVAAGRSVTVTISAATQSTTWSLNGTTVLAAGHGGSGSRVFTTDANGQVKLTVASAAAVNGNTITLTASPEGLSGGDTAAITVAYATPTFTVRDLNNAGAATARTITTNGSYTYELFVGDQYKTPIEGDYRIQLSTTGRAVTGGNFPLTNGRASVSITDAGLGSGSTITVTLQLQRNVSGTWSDFSTNVTAFGSSTITVNAAPATALVPAVAYVGGASPATLSPKAISEFNTATSRGDFTSPAGTVVAEIALAGIGVVNGESATISAPGLFFGYRDDATITRIAKDTMTFVVDDTTADEILIFSNLSVTNRDVTFTSRGRTATVKVSFSAALANSVTNVALAAPANAAPGTTFQVTATLTDVFGNPVAIASGDTSGVSVTYTGPGIVFGTLPSTTDKTGKLSFAVLLGSNDKGSASVVVTYNKVKTTEVAANIITKSSTITVGTATGAGTVNVGSFNGKLVVYASNLDGKRISWKVGGNWGKATAVGNTLNRFDRPTPRRGVTVSVEIYVDGVKTLTKSVVTR